MGWAGEVYLVTINRIVTVQEKQFGGPLVFVSVMGV